MVLVLEIIMAYLAITLYIGFWFGLNQIETPDQKDAASYVAFNTAIMPIAIPIGVFIGLRNMLSGGIVVVFHVVDVEHDGSLVETERQYLRLVDQGSQSSDRVQRR